MDNVACRWGLPDAKRTVTVTLLELETNNRRNGIISSLDLAVGGGTLVGSAFSVFTLGQGKGRGQSSSERARCLGSLR